VNKVIGVVAAHPDDEILGCGATIAKYVAQDFKVHVLILSEGLTSRAVTRKEGGSEEALDTLKKIAQQANKKIGVSSVQFCNFPDNRMDSVDFLDVVKQVEFFLEKTSPKIVYTHFPADLNIDHQITSRAVVTATRTLPASCVEKVFFFEVLSSTEWNFDSGLACSFSPNWFEEVAETFSKKIEALKVYASEMRDWPHPRSFKAVEHLAAFRGSTTGVDYAESFILARCVKK